MQITLSFTCRECGRENHALTDTANYGSVAIDLLYPLIYQVHVRGLFELRCTCGHVSGEVGLGYRYPEDHRPSHEREAHGE